MEERLHIGDRVIVTLQCYEFDGVVRQVLKNWVQVIIVNHLIDEYPIEAVRKKEVVLLR